MDGTYTALDPVKDILYLVMTALRKMPIVHSKPLYRGIRGEIVNTASKSIIGSIKDSKMAPKIPSRTNSDSSTTVEHKEECKRRDELLLEGNHVRIT